MDGSGSESERAIGGNKDHRWQGFGLGREGGVGAEVKRNVLVNGTRVNTQQSHRHG
jgi:hypothetical protein